MGTIVTKEDAALIDEMLRSPQAEALRKEQARKVRASRVSLLAERSALNVRAEAQAVAHAPVKAAAEERVARARAALDAEILALGEVQSRYHMVVFEFEQARRQIDGALHESAPHEAFMVEYEALAALSKEALRHNDDVQSLGIDGYNHRRWDNGPSIRKRLEAISAAQCELRDMVLTAVDAAEISATAERLRAGLPAIEERPQNWLERWFR